MRGVGNGWVVSGVVQAYSGPNLQQNSNNQNFGLTVPAPSSGGNSEYAVGARDRCHSAAARVICDPKSNLQDGQYINGACFAPPIAGVNGKPGVNRRYSLLLTCVVRLITTRTSRCSRSSAFSESRKLQFRAQAYNFLNHPFNSFIGSQDPNLTLNFNAAGQLTNHRFGYTDSKVGHRTMMLGVKFFF